MFGVLDEGLKGEIRYLNCRIWVNCVESWESTPIEKPQIW